MTTYRWLRDDYENGQNEVYLKMRKNELFTALSKTEDRILSYRFAMSKNR